MYMYSVMLFVRSFLFPWFYVFSFLFCWHLLLSLVIKTIQEYTLLDPSHGKYNRLSRLYCIIIIRLPCMTCICLYYVCYLGIKMCWSMKSAFKCNFNWEQSSKESFLFWHARFYTNNWLKYRNCRNFQAFFFQFVWSDNESDWLLLALTEHSSLLYIIYLGRGWVRRLAALPHT